MITELRAVTQGCKVCCGLTVSPVITFFESRWQFAHDGARAESISFRLPPGEGPAVRGYGPMSPRARGGRRSVHDYVAVTEVWRFLGKSPRTKPAGRSPAPRRPPLRT